MDKSNRITGLDGVRALALIFVLADHSQSSPLTPWDELGDYLPRLGRFGVMIFFVLSGFLQTESLLRDEEKYGRISAISFYCKRILRILPLFLIFLMFICGWGAMTSYDVSLFDVASVLLCFKHIFGGAPLLAHFWSLSIEILFYITWPILLSGLPQVKRARVVLAMAVLLPLTAPLIRIFIPDTPEFYPSQLFRAGPIFLGCWLVFAMRSPGSAAMSKVFKGSQSMLLFLSLVIGAAGMYGLTLSKHWSIDTLCYVLRLAGAGLLVVSAMNCNNRILFRILNNSCASWLAAISYGVYVWQQFFFFGNPNDWVNPWIPKNLLVQAFWFPGNIILSIAIGAASFYFIEKPLHPWRGRIAARFKQGMESRSSYFLPPK